jgi:GNAT superfamily N-acetyltransferase
MSEPVEFFDNREYGFGQRPLFGGTLSNRQHGGYYAYYSLKLNNDDRVPYHELHLFSKDHTPVGRLEWSHETGEIHNIDVAKDHRRRGVATAAYQLAHRLASEYGVTPPKHSRDRSDQGDAWARAVGGELPTRLTSRDFPDLNSEPSPLARQLEEYGRNQNS